MGKQRITQSQGSGGAGTTATIGKELAEEALRVIEYSLKVEEVWSREIVEVVNDALELGTFGPCEQRALRGFAKDCRRGEKRIRKRRHKANRLKRRL